MRIGAWVGGSRSARVGVVLVLLACTLGARIPELTDALWQDEVGTERVIAKPTLSAAFDQVVGRESTPPVFYLTAWALNRVASRVAARDDAVVLLRLLPLVLSLGTTGLTFLLAVRLLPLWVAALAGLLISFGSELVLHGAELRAYSLLAFACVAFAYLLERAAAAPRTGRLAAVAAIVAVGSLTHYFFLSTVAAGVVWLLAAVRDPVVVRRVGAAAAVGLVPLAAWAPYGLRQYEHQNYGASPRFTLGRLVEVVTTLFAPQPILASLGAVAETGGFLVVVGSAAVFFVRRPDARLVALLALLPLATTASVAALGPRVFNARNLIGMAPFAAIGLAWACASLPWRRAGPVAAAVCAALVLAGYAAGQATLGRTPYGRVALAATAQGFRKGEPVIWFGRYGGYFPVRWYLAAYAPPAARPRLSLAELKRGRCGALTAIVRGATGRRWLDRHRASVLAAASLPSYGDNLQDRRNRYDVLVVRLRWTPGVLADALAAEASLFHRNGAVSPCDGAGARAAPSGAPPATARRDPDDIAGTIAFDVYRHGNNELHAVSPDGSGRRRLTPEQAGGSQPAWSPDGRAIAFVSYRDGDGDIYVMDVRGAHQRRVTRGDADDGHPAWSPDGRTIAFDELGRDGRARVLVVGVDGHARRVVTPDGMDAAHPSWSPDGRTIAFDAVHGGRAAIYIVRAGSSRPHRLSGNGDAFPAWSPDGRAIAFDSVRDGNAEIYVMDTDGRRQRRVTRDPAFDEHPAWSPSGRAIVFSSNLDDGTDGDLYVANADGSARRRLTGNEFPSRDPAWSAVAARSR